MLSLVLWVGTVITALTSETGALAPLLPLFAIGIAISAVLLGRCFAQVILKGSNSVKLSRRQYRAEVLYQV